MSVAGTSRPDNRPWCSDMGLIIYIASSFSLIDRVSLIAERIENLGHTIAVKWWDRSWDIPGEGEVHTTDLKERYKDLDPDEFYNKPACKIAYESDVEGVKACDVFLFVAGDEPRAYNGANIELGIALGAGKPCYSIGTLATSALYYAVYRCGDEGHFLRILEVESQLKEAF